MKFTPVSDKELSEINLLPKGVYNFHVVEAEECVSKKGNQMIKLKLKVDNGNRSIFLFDYLLEAFYKKLSNFCKVTGLTDKYEQGEINANDCLQKKGAVEIDIEAECSKPSGGTYPAKNTVKNYILPNKKSLILMADNDFKDDPDFEDDQVPF